MSRYSPLLLLAVALSIPAPAAPQTSELPAPPPTRQEDFKEVLHGVEIADPYRWLEDQQSPETRRWIEAQNRYTRSLLDPLPFREAIRRRLTELWRVDTTSIPVEERAGRYLFFKKKAEEELATLYLRRGLDGKDEAILDPRSLSADLSVTADPMELSRDGRRLIYGLRRGGEDEMELRVLDLDTRRDLPDRFPRGLYRGVAWKPDGSGFYYNLQSRETGTLTRFHKLGAAPADDAEVFGRGLGRDVWAGVSEVSDDGRFVLFDVGHGWSYNDLYLQDLTAGGPPRLVTPGLKATLDVQFAGGRLLAMTDWQKPDGAPNGRIVAIDPRDPAPEKWREIVPAGPDALQGFAVAGGKLFVHSLRDVTSRIRIFSLDGKPEGEVPLPGPGSVGILQARADGGEVFFGFQSFTVPPVVYRYDVAARRVDTWAQDRPPFQPALFETRQVWYTSKDGTRVPMFLVHRKGLEPNGQLPTRLYGYGGFRSSQRPFFSVTNAFWIEQGGVYALANIRGGSEFGEDWHRAGMLEKKQNVFDDFIAAAEWLVANRYTNPAKLAIEGGSNGGLLVGAALTQRPDLFRAVVCRFPDLDMIGYRRFENNNPPALQEYGDASKPEHFKFLLAYSPYQKVKPGTKYPAVLLTTGDNDTRVPPLQARKMTARLQAATASGIASGRPVLLLYDTVAGHAGGRTAGKVIEDSTLELAFVAWQLGMEVK
ncbi:MAG TPA: prolyl oligopeptidase family serine peptidase [Thermoanaerobaculia bacterium]|nr:prolyl oligopeptidase family serine peptidase [Thermoanaerobaculia bacterium]